MPSPWIEAMRLRTLPVSCSGVVVAVALGNIFDCIIWAPAILCLVFALLAQIASNFANEYFDFRAGLDRPGREGPRRGVTEGDITPRAMLIATCATLGIAAIIGCLLILWGGWLLLPVGIATILGVMAYSAGPYPLSRHCLGEVAVIIFFGIVPVNMTYYIFCQEFTLEVALFSLAIGLMSANILVVNNYRDAADDASVGKHTLATRFGTRFSLYLYLFNGIIAMTLTAPLLCQLPIYVWCAPAIYLMLHFVIWTALRRRTGRALNPLLGITSCNLLLYSVIFAILSAL